MSNRKLGLAIAGLGNWGSRVLRAFARVDRAEVLALCDLDPARLAAHSRGSGGASMHTDLSRALADGGVEAVVIATPPASHAPLALQALRAGCDVLVEKPMALCPEDAGALEDAANGAGRQLMVGHILHYHPAFECLQELLAAGKLGRLRHVLCERRGRSTPRHETAWWSLAPHDLSLLRLLFGNDPSSLTASAARGVSPDVVNADLTFPDGGTARIEVSAVDPHKTRRLTIVGERGVAVFDDREPEHKLRLYAVPAADHHGPGLALDRIARSPACLGGECIDVPVLSEEPLVREACHFVHSILDGRPVRTGASLGRSVVRWLAEGQAQLDAAEARAAVRPSWEGKPPLAPA